MSAKTVFLSYSHDSPEHSERVLSLSERLRDDGIETRLDQYVNGTPIGGWPRWMLDRLDEADSVIVVCTETYYRRFRGHELPGKGKGADWEGALITQEIYDARGSTLKFIPVLFAAEDEAFIPEPLRAGMHYLLNSEQNYNDLYDFLLGQAGVEARPVGELRTKERRRGTPLTLDQPRQVISPEVTRTTTLNPRRRKLPADYDDDLVSRVAITLDEAKPLTMRALALQLNELFNRGTFRFEPLRECVTQEWGSRLHVAMQTLELLRLYSSVFFDLAPDNRTFEKLMDEVNGYCLAMATCLFQGPVAVSEMRNFVGSDDEFLSKLPSSKYFATIPDDVNQKVDGPRERAVEQIDKLRKEFVQRAVPKETTRPKSH